MGKHPNTQEAFFDLQSVKYFSNRSFALKIPLKYVRKKEFWIKPNSGGNILKRKHSSAAVQKQL